ncbi:hypothetical protein TNCV_3644161 [Trichonephila clavipes]|nr:hypothetical protein TNCV_3644161 [Trichonephila clavipes]
MSQVPVSTKDKFPVTEVITFQWSHSFKRESTQDTGGYRGLGSRAIQPLITLYPAVRVLTGTVPQPISGSKVHRTRGDKDQ